MEKLKIEVLLSGKHEQFEGFWNAVKAVRGAEPDFQREWLVEGSYPIFYGGDTHEPFGHMVTVNYNFPYAWVIFPGLVLAAGLKLWKQAAKMEKL